MNRRQFVRYPAFGGLSVTLGSFSPFAQSISASKNDQAPLTGLQTIDAHVHPNHYVYNSRPTDTTSTLKVIKKFIGYFEPASGDGFIGTYPIFGSLTCHGS